MRLLIAEADSGARASLAAAVEAHDHEVVTAESGTEALKALLRDGVDAIVSAPELDGLTLADLRERLASMGGTTALVALCSSFDQRLKALASGADETLGRPVDPSEVQLRLVAVERLVDARVALLRQRWDLVATARQLHVQGRVDALTGINNRVRLEEDLATLHARLMRHGHGFAVALFDVDHFKAYNDTAGHQAGDDVLRRIADVLEGSCRATDWVYRYGGEEFAALYPDTSRDQAWMAAERMRLAVLGLALPHPGLPDGACVTLSGGVGSSDRDASRDPIQALKQADEALYAAKSAGRNRVFSG